MSRLTASRVAFDLIASFEGYRARAARAPDGHWTLGFGHTATAREGLIVTRTEAEELLRWDLLPIEDTLRQVALMPLSQNQFDALVSFAFNIGLENFKHSNVLKSLNQGQPVAAALGMHAWRRARVNGHVLTIDALVRRRAAEAALFLETAGARPAAPTSVIRPQIDYAATSLSTGAEAPLVLHEANPAQSDELRENEDSGAVDEAPLIAEKSPAPDQSSNVAIAAMPERVVTPTLVAQTPSVANDTEAIADAEEGVFVLASAAPAPAPTVPADQVAETAQVSLITPPLDIPEWKPPAPEPTLTEMVRELDPAIARPIVPLGLSPFPGNQEPMPANGSRLETDFPANDGAYNRLYGVPEAVEAPVNDQASLAKAEKQNSGPAIAPLGGALNGVSPKIWGLTAFGSMLLAGGLFYAWQSGILTPQTVRPEPTGAQLTALLAAASGFIIVVTSVVTALTGGPEAQE